MTVRLTLICLCLFFFPGFTIAQQWEPLGPFETPAMIRPNDWFLKMSNGIGRVSCLRVPPGKTQELYLGTPYGGLWYSKDKSHQWEPIEIQNIPNAGIADLVFHPADRKVMFLATGDPDCMMNPNEPALGSESCQSGGLMKSIDGGLNWKGPYGTWYDTLGNPVPDFWKYPTLKIMRRVLIDPEKPEIMYALVATYNYKENLELSYLFRSSDGGENWHVVHTLHGQSLKDIEFKPGKSSIVYASASTVFKSADRGKTWKSLQSNGLVEVQHTTRCEVAVCPSRPENVYALIVNKQTRVNELYLSENEGKSFTKVCSARASPEWRTCMVVEPGDPNIVYISSGNKLSVLHRDSVNFKVVFTTRDMHDDLHDLMIDPRDGWKYASTDGGIYFSSDSNTVWTEANHNLNMSECWSVAVSQEKDFYILAGLQDCGTIRYMADSTGKYSWVAVRGGDGMEAAIDYKNPNVCYSNDGHNKLMVRSEDRGATWSRNKSKRSEPAAYLLPFIIHPQDPETLYTGYRNLYRSSDKGETWEKVSDADPRRKEDLLIAIAVAPSDPDIHYISYNNPSWTQVPDGKVYVSIDNCGTWKDVSSGLAGANYFSVSSLAIDPFSAATVYAAFKGGAQYKVMRSLNHGESWENYSEGLPEYSDINVLIADRKTGDLYAGTHHGVWKKKVDQAWRPFNEGLPVVMISDLDINLVTREMVAGTHGRGVWKISIDGKK